MSDLDLASALEQKDQVIKFLTAQVESHKQAVNEFLAANLQLKTNCNMLQQSLAEANAKLAAVPSVNAELDPA